MAPQKHQDDQGGGELGGHKGGQRVRELVEEGRQTESGDSSRK